MCRLVGNRQALVSVHLRSAAVLQGGQWQLALGFFRKLGKWTLHADAVSYGADTQTVPISSSCRCKNLDVLACLDDRLPCDSCVATQSCKATSAGISKQFCLDRFAIAKKAISACAQGHQWILALTLLDEMPAASTRRNTSSGLLSCHWQPPTHGPVDCGTHFSLSLHRTGPPVPGIVFEDHSRRELEKDRVIAVGSLNDVGR